MTPADLRAICDSLDGERGTGGQSEFVRLLDWHHSTVWRKLNGKSPITRSDELAIVQALAAFRCQRKLVPGDDLSAIENRFRCHIAAGVLILSGESSS